MYSLLTVTELKKELRHRNASVTGKKAALIERLEAYDRNLNFGQVPPGNKDPIYYCPSSEFFKDINADSPIPVLNNYEIQSYFERFDSSPKGKTMYEARCLLTARYAVEGSNFYIKGLCKAQMKQVAYVVNVKLTNEGAIEQSNCECAAGSGIEAHCKHVSVLLYAVEDITVRNSIILQQVCTQQLMNFKKPGKVFHKSPIQAQNIPVLKNRKRKVNYNPVKDEDIISNYEDYVRNIVTNHGPSTMPILHLYPPANPYAIEWDRNSYLSKDPKNLILEKLLLSNVSMQQITEIEEKTRAQAASPIWHEMRSHRATASMFYLICHSSIATKKKNAERIMNPKPIFSRSITHGKINESIAISKYEGTRLQVQKCGLFLSEEYPFLAASPDGLLGDETIIEVKCPYAARYRLIDAVTIPYLQIVNGHLILKENHPYYAQIQGQLFCTGRKYCNLIIYTYIDMKVIFLTRNDDYIIQMVPELVVFYENFLKKCILETYYYKNYDLIKQI